MENERVGGAYNDLRGARQGFKRIILLNTVATGVWIIIGDSVIIVIG